MTNQLGISKKYIREEDFIERMGKFLVEANIKACILASIRDDEYRKPCIGTYDYIM